ncbi:MAG TPA: CAP domain-containing protein [Gemmataceae bacterium]|nr:CAP domain-containing protein [Gemmataceae bacterium]
MHLLCLAFTLSLTTVSDHSWEWRTRPDDPARVYLFDKGVQVGGWDYVNTYYRAFDGSGWKAEKEKQAPVTPPSQIGISALAEVNALRARSGLAPYAYDEGLSRAAQAAAEYRANYLISGHTSNDFGFVPAGSSASAAGCAAWPPSMGWGSCCCYDHYRCAGAGWAMGRDGQRYMHLFVR